MGAFKKLKDLFNCYVPAPVAFLAGVAFRQEAKLIGRNSEILETSIAATEDFISGTITFSPGSGPERAPSPFRAGTVRRRSGTERPARPGGLHRAGTKPVLDAGDDHVRFGMCRRSFPESLKALESFLSSAL